MGRVVEELLRDWAVGVVTSMASDELPPNASPRGHNSYLTYVGGGRAVPAKRMGMACVNETAVTGSGRILGHYQYKRLSGGSFTSHHLIVSVNGRLDVLDHGAGTVAAADSGTPTPFSSSAYPDFETANNLCFIVNGTDQKKFDGTDVWEMGIDRPTVGTMAGAAGAAGSPNGTYALRVTYYNGNTGHESSISDTATATVTVANQQINVTNIPVSGDGQVTARRIYVRNTASMANFYLAGTLNNNSGTSLTLNFTDASLITVGPDTSENDPPPATSKYLTWHRSRMFVADDENVYWSKVDLPEAFDPDAYVPINPNDGDRITALHAASDVLLIFKQRALYAIVGDDPETWTVETVAADVGCVAHRSVFTIEGKTYFWSLQGPMVWEGGPPRPIGLPLIRPTVTPTTLAYAELDDITGAPDFQNELAIWAVAELGGNRNTMLLPFNYRLGSWVSNKWNPMDVAALAVVEDTSSNPYVYVGNYAGQIFKWWSGTNDGVVDGTTEGTVTSHTTTTLTDSGATFNTTGAGLAERYVYIIDPQSTDVQRIRISSNTATALTLATNITGTVTGYSYAIGAIDFQWDTRWEDAGQPFRKKRYEFVYGQAESTTGTVTVTIDLFLDYDDTAPARTYTFTTNSSGGVWDTSEWDDAVFGSPGISATRKRVGKTGKAWLARFRNIGVAQNVTLLKAGMRAEMMTDKS